MQGTPSDHVTGGWGEFRNLPGGAEAAERLSLDDTL